MSFEEGKAEGGSRGRNVDTVLMGESLRNWDCEYVWGKS